jgi:hypothetical protein
MGVTIHFAGQLLGDRAFDDLVRTTTAFAESRTWLTERIESEEATLLRVDENEQNWDYIGPTKGIVTYPNEDCDPVRLEFDKDLYIQEYVKTQFAGVAAHLSVVELLQTLQPFFRKLKVEDEGEFWETGNIEILREHMQRIQHVIDEEKSKNPSVQVKVKTPSGRIMDLLS